MERDSILSLLNGLIDNMPSGFVMTGAGRKIEFVSRSFETWSGWPAAQLVGRPLFDAIPTCPRLEKSADFGAADNPYTAVTTERTLVIGDGSERRVLISMFLIHDEDGNEAGIAVNVIDVSDFRRIQDRIAQSQKMEALSKLTLEVAHEFGRMLALIAGDVETLAAVIGEHPPAYPYLDNLRYSTRSASALVRRLRDCSGLQTPAAEPTEINPLITDIIAQFQSLFDLFSPSVTVREALDPVPRLAMADPVNLKSAILNLVSNALESMPAGGELTLETGFTRIAPTEAQWGIDLKPGDYVTISVIDTGSGMPADVAVRASEPFFTTKLLGQAKGLGLSMAHGFAKRCNGHLEILSGEGRGTEIRLYLPVADPVLDSGESSNVVHMSSHLPRRNYGVS